MLNPLEYRIRLFGLAAVLVLAALVSGCALGTSHLVVMHDPLDSIENKREGTILVREFVDKRLPEHSEFIGVKRNGYGMPLGEFGCGESCEVEVLLTRYFARALREAGYEAVIDDDASASGDIKFDAIVEGEVLEFWVDCYMVAWHEVEVLVRLLDDETEEVVWEKAIAGSHSNTIWWSFSEIETVIRKSLAKALNEAASEFSSDEFYGHIEGRQVQ